MAGAFKARVKKMVQNFGIFPYFSGVDIHAVRSDSTMGHLQGSGMFFFFQTKRRHLVFFWIFWQTFSQLLKQTFQLLQFFTIFNMFQLGCLEDVELPEKK